MGFRFRKSIGSGPFRVNFSKSGIGYSVGGKGFRYTKKANGGTRTTMSIPGTGVSYVKDYSNKNKGASMKQSKKTASVKSKTPEQAPKLQTQTLHVTGLNQFADNLKKLAKLNPDWKLSAEEILVSGKDGQNIFQCKFTNSPAELLPVSDHPKNPNAVAVKIAGLQIGYLEEAVSTQIKKLLKSGQIMTISCGIFGGKYKIVDEFGSVSTKSSPIKAAVKITYSTSIAPLPPTKKSTKNEKKTKTKKPIHKRWWFWLLLLSILFGSCNNGGEDATVETAPIETTIATFSTVNTETSLLATETEIPTTAIHQTEPTTTPTETKADPIQTVATELPAENTAPTAAVIPVVPAETAPPVEIPQTEFFEVEPQGTLYILNKNTKKFHDPYCRYVDDIAPHNREDFLGSRDTVIGRNFIPCKVCDP